MGDRADLARVLGHPCPLDPLPLNHSPAWIAARLAIQAEVFRVTGVRGRIRSPAALWGALRGGVPPSGATWGDLTGGVGLSQLVHALRAPPAQQGLRLAVWNVRWLVSGRDQGASKRECIRRWIDVGRAVALCETHWRAADAAVWANHFPGASVVYACAVPGPNGGGPKVVLP